MEKEEGRNFRSLEVRRKLIALKKRAFKSFKNEINEFIICHGKLIVQKHLLGKILLQEK